MIAGRARPLVSVGTVWFCWLGLAPAPAQARPFRVTLEYVAGPGCPGVTEFKTVVAGRLGYDPFAPDAPDRVLVQVVPRQGAIEGRLEWRDATGAWTGDQTFPTATTDCARFARVVGFALAVQIQLLANVRPDPDPAAEPEAPQVSPRVLDPPPARPLPPVVSAAPVLPPARRRSGPELAVGIGPAVAFGMADAPIVLGRIFGVLAWTHVAIELAAQTSFPTTTRRADGAGFSQQHLLLGVAGCAVFTPGTACLLANAGEVRMAGVDIDRPTSAVAPVIQAGARLGAAHLLGRRVVIGAHADGLAALTRWRGTLDNVAVWTAPRLAAAVGVDAVVRFP